MIKRLLVSIKDWFIITIVTALVRISIALHGTENELLKGTAESIDKRVGRFIPARIRSRLLQKMLQGERDEQYVNDFYEILKKADKFMLNLTPEKAEIAADKYGMSLGKKDKWGRRYDHYGFFDPKNKNYGKTLREVFQAEVEQRKVSDDDYTIEIMFKNEPIVHGFTKTDVSVVSNPLKDVLSKKFPLRTIYHGDGEKTINRIEKLTDYLHVKRLDETYKILEFFIPAKFGIHKIGLEDERIKEMLNIKQIWFNDEYGGTYGYTIENFYKMVQYGENKLKENENSPDHLYDIIKFNAIKIKEL